VLGLLTDTVRTQEMAQKLTDGIVKGLPAPSRGNKVHYDTVVKGFGCRVTAAGARAFVLNYRTRAGRERRYTIGAFPEWRTVAAREEAAELKKRIDRGEDPLAEIQAGRDAPTVSYLAERYIEEHLPKKRQGSQLEDRSMIATRVLPALGALKVADVTFSDIDGLHRKITKGGTPLRANRVVALLSKMFALAIKWRMRTDNPCRGVERNPENKRTRYLSGAEIAALTDALTKHDDQQAANIVRSLLFTGARRGEVLAAKWEDIDLESGVWTKPGATTKQKTLHRVPLSAPARLLLWELKATAVEGEYVFPGRARGHRVEIKSNWARLCKAARITGARVHDLRHTYASIAASSGASLPTIGALIGHSQAQTTHRYAHLLDDPLRAATERVGSIISPPRGVGAKIIKIGDKSA
jgi:integrase